MNDKSPIFLTLLHYSILNIVPLKIPPLRERKEDIPLLVNHFIKLYNKEYHRRIKKFSPEVMECFYNYGWKGNVRELENVIQRLFVVSPKLTISIKELPIEMIKEGVSGKLVFNSNYSLEEALSKFEKDYIRQALLKTKNNRRKASQLLGIHRNTLLNRIKTLGLDKKL